MIRINLLPEEYRKKSRTPIKLLVAISAVVAVSGMPRLINGMKAVRAAAK